MEGQGRWKGKADGRARLMEGQGRWKGKADGRARLMGHGGHMSSTDSLSRQGELQRVFSRRW
jgi:hypothetical protein